MIEKFIDKRFGDAALVRIGQCNEIVANYQAQGLRLTLRQLYYQLVTVNAIPNVESAYKNLGALVSDARLAGLMDWEAIEDRVRQPREVQEWSSPASLIEAALGAYRLPRWRGQNSYVELWVEKDALAGVLRPLADKWHVTLMVNRGYSSQSAMYEAAQRFIDGTGQVWEDDAHTDAQRDRNGYLFYLGDHDPSGEDMVRDIAHRLRRFGVMDLMVGKIALTREQISQYRPPPNPAKMTDSRAAAYVAKHGRSSWEVDALPPEVLTRLIDDAFARVVDVDVMEGVKKREEADKKAMRRAFDKFITRPAKVKG